MAHCGGDGVAGGCPGRQWPLPLADRVLLIACYYRTTLTMRQLAPQLALESTGAPGGRRC